jgi:[ribosomal protein S18]-alanine N-acetyltransferase
MTVSQVHKEQIKISIRWMIRRDMPDVLRTEQESFDHAWTEDDFLRCLRQRNFIGMVAEVSERVVGFMIYELHRHKLHILNFAVSPEYRRYGIATQMLGKLIVKLSSHRRTRITLAVRESNLGAQLFFRMRDFRAVKVLRHYYEDSGEDAYLMQYHINQELLDEFEEPVNRIAQYQEER